MKLWGGRFKKSESKLMEDFNSSLGFDRRFYREDIEGSMAHVKMLSKCGILSQEEGKSILAGLKSILEDIENGKLKIEGDYEDIHSFVEINLIDRIGQVAKKLHTARSRNDQVAVDFRLYAKRKALEVVEDIEILQATIKEIGQQNNVIMPGYTHLQRAQVITFKHYIMAYYSMLSRDKKRILNAVEIMDESPLGCCALAGTTYDIDRNFTAKELGFKKPVDNFLDGVSDRDYVIEILSDFSIIMMHLSRLSEELILWSSKEFDFVQIDDEFSTGSSIMPQKKNPDAAELIRGKTGRVYGSLMALLTTMKGIPLAYNKDMQEDKEQFFNSLDTILSCLKIMNGILSTLKVNEKNTFNAVKKGFLNATEAADYLVDKGMAFRDAHKVIGEIVLYCEDKNKSIEDLSLEELKNFSPLFGKDVYGFIDYENTLNRGIKKNLK
ncbi:argininosuccinate lyase [Clostridium luticellarii]|jgi:argininosuccinate lyase|uniref:Argininosuccinate lyase n=1 Tax=Clostridium luticellarii TaxID=1691940 RepID=A0A2T0BKK2_9CLOT|nr:argininosuccinate lyase [Clostridium luticellarii]MCI1946066.1 argininosuccinate lyase [Clostridium luticellarii]MCI1967528.1 argininosuccinate lyase [Clostridium luticellarii]MCI1996429.1 argininosuccinate lyase [Clostridium luticellarii]MCI2040782.1 argininosuccinate lyase [Clostridium luticellarii]PRR84428.1 Argininosuccinate lyase [Clostridium luticellarii]